MSSEAVEWARDIRGRSIAQRELLLALAEVADGRGFVGALTAVQWSVKGFTPREAEKTAEGLLRLGYLTKMWNPDKYVWHWYLNIRP